MANSRGMETTKAYRNTASENKYRDVEGPMPTVLGNGEGTNFFAVLERIEKHLDGAEYTANDIYSHLFGIRVQGGGEAKPPSPTTVRDRLSEIEMRISNLCSVLIETQNRI